MVAMVAMVAKSICEFNDNHMYNISGDLAQLLHGQRASKQSIEGPVSQPQYV